MSKDSVKPYRRIADTKRCPYCSTPIPRNAEQCFACKGKVGEMGKYGLAKKPFDWKAYLLCLISVVALGVYMWWAFFRK
ncbi:MAG: hypothetical protein FP816_21085 [Desulfobacteraceae bacterium]|nr:hypothetical protein [Desulfobacteraceae bacterium]MBU4001575.1 hypothetical protein [Pseudomonadota bacterium]MBU4053873.1 hypothetical protein [Pseudomonadota bacterium]